MSRFEVYEAQDGEWRWRLIARNGEIVATGEGYKTRNGAIRGTESMRRAAVQAKLKVLDPAKS
jgi:uncharacterized protein YegP (UPF0339 family)